MEKVLTFFDGLIPSAKDLEKLGQRVYRESPPPDVPLPAWPLIPVIGGLVVWRQKKQLKKSMKDS